MSSDRLTPTKAQNKATVLEAINVRLYDIDDRQRVIAAFNQLRRHFTGVEAHLFQHEALEGDWSIFIRRRGLQRRVARSPEARFVADLLREIGLIHQAAWWPVNPDPGDGE